METNDTTETTLTLTEREMILIRTALTSRMIDHHEVGRTDRVDEYQALLAKVEA